MRFTSHDNLLVHPLLLPVWLCLLRRSREGCFLLDNPVPGPPKATIELMSDLLVKSRHLHSNVLVGSEVFFWGGALEDYSLLVHDSPKKRQFTSLVETFNPLTFKTREMRTIGNPPNAMQLFCCTSIGNDIYYFGGNCETNKCYHNNLFVLDTLTKKWREVIPSGNGPMNKAVCGMVSFNSDGKDYLLVIGGIGMFPDRVPAHSKYIAYPIAQFEHLCHTNEVHLMCVSSSPGKWKVPLKKVGDFFPPCAGFTLNALPGNKAILFGGGTTGSNGQRQRTNNTFLISLAEDSVKFRILVKPADPAMQWPTGRSFHSSVVISGASHGGIKRPYLLILGGQDNDDNVVPDCWVMDVLDKQWEQIFLPDPVTNRSRHSMSAFSVSRNFVRIMVHGGVSSSRDFVSGPNLLMVVELAFYPAVNKWFVRNVMNSDDLKIHHHMLSKSDAVIPEEEPDSDGRSEDMIRDQMLQMRTELTILQREHTESYERLQEKQDEITELHDCLEALYESRYQEKQDEIAELQDCLESRPWVLEEEEVILTNERIGGGAYGEVKVALFRGTRVAAKCLHQLIVSDYNRGVFTREMEISSRIHHPNIVQFVGATRVNNPILLYELMATSLHKKLEMDGPLTHPQILDVCCDLAMALSYIHQWRPTPIIHRDVSSPNVLMEPLANGKWRSKLSDFGSANLQLHVKTVIPGNPAYAAPEARDPQQHSPAMDVYSFGILVTEMILHCPPEMDILQRSRQVRRIDWQPMKVLLLNCTNSDHSQRPTSFQLLMELKNLK